MLKKKKEKKEEPKVEEIKHCPRCGNKRHEPTTDCDAGL